MWWKCGGSPPTKPSQWYTSLSSMVDTPGTSVSASDVHPSPYRVVSAGDGLMFVRKNVALTPRLAHDATAISQ